MWSRGYISISQDPLSFLCVILLSLILLHNNTTHPSIVQLMMISQIHSRYGMILRQSKLQQIIFRATTNLVKVDLV